MSKTRSWAALQLATVAGVAVLVGHWLAYLVAVPHAGLRDELLLTSGHGYWLLAVKVALVLGTACLAASAADALRRRTRGDDEPAGWGALSALVALAVVQLCSFTVLEAGERVLAGEPWLQMLHHDVYAWGLVAQLALAPLGAAFLVLLTKTLRRVATISIAVAACRPRAAHALAVPDLPLYVPARDWRGVFSTRGPPA
jgi:hypothetical protein